MLIWIHSSTHSGSTLRLSLVVSSLIHGSAATTPSWCSLSSVCACTPLKLLETDPYLSYSIGHIILVGSATPSSLEHTDTALGLLVLSIAIMGLGAGAIKANVSTMIAEQYTGKLRKETLPSGEVILRDPAVTVQTIYLWFYAAINFGSCGAISAAFIARDHGYWQSYLVPTCIFAIVSPLLLS